MTDLETLELAWEFFGKGGLAGVTGLAVVARENYGWGGTAEDAIRMFQGSGQYRVYQHAVTGEWVVQRLRSAPE